MKFLNAFQIPMPLWNATTEGAPSALTTGTTTDSSTTQTTEGAETDEGTEGEATEVSTATEGEAEAQGEGESKEGEGTAEPFTLDALTMPEGFTLEEEAGNSFLEIMNNPELSPQERAQSLIDLQASVTASASEAAEAANQTLWDETQAAWQDELSKLPDIGGKELPKTLAQIKKGLESVGADKDTFAAFDLTGAGNHPAIIKVLHALTKTKVEGKPVTGTTATKPADRASRMYGGKS